MILLYFHIIRMLLDYVFAHESISSNLIRQELSAYIFLDENFFEVSLCPLWHENCKIESNIVCRGVAGYMFLLN